MRNTDRQWEEQYLSQTLQVVERNLENYSRETRRMQAEIDEMLEHYHDNDAELWVLLNNTITLNEHMKMALARNKKAKDKPYFGRIIFQDETFGVEESLYIGRGGISRDSTHQMVVDWRAPVATAYYENGLGRCSYPAPDGTQMPIDLKLKRTYEIADGRLTNYFDTEVIANDDLLTKYLSKNKQAVLGEIVATIQKEQNEIIRKSPYHNVIVQGVAGSGKTTVAMHRISYILYNYKERFRPEDFYIVGSNRILLNYITGVLPDLDVYGVRQMTMEQLLIRLLYEDWDEKKYHVRPVAGSSAAAQENGNKSPRQDETVKGTEGWYQELIGFIRRLEQDAISQDSIYLNPRQFVEGIRDGKSGVYDLTGEAGGQSEAVKQELVELVSGDAVARYVSQNPNISIQSKINMLNERLLIKVKDEFTGKGIKYTEAEQKAILKAYRGRYGAREWKKSIFTLYQEFLQEQRGRGCEVQIPLDSFDVYDLAALALLYKLVKETEVISEAHHIVIDEAQDFGMFVYRVLFTCIKDCTYTIMGDVSQNIHFGYGLRDWEALRALLLSDPYDSFGVLKKSYRNTVEISNFATDILRHGSFSVYPVEPIIRHGAKAAVEQAGSGSSQKEIFVKRAADICRGWQQKGYDTIAVVCRDQKAAERAAAELSGHIEIMESDLEKTDFGSGIMVLPVEYTKGLEFDAVLIWNPSREDYPVDDGHARLLYVAATRALHELCVLHTGSLTVLIADPLPAVPSAPEAEKHTDMDMEQGDAACSPAAEITREDREAEIAQKPNVSPKPEASRKPEGSPKPQASRKPDISPKPDHGSRRAVAVRPKDSGTESRRAAENEPTSKMAGTQRQDKTASGAYRATAGGEKTALSFGDMPPTERLRPAGHSKISLSVKWCSRQADGLYLQSQYGTLRISPIGSGIVRITFAKGTKIIEGTHPLINEAAGGSEKNWKYRDSGRVIEFSSAELLLQVDKSSGAVSYLTPEKKLLLAERKQGCRQIEGSRIWISLDWQKGEQLLALGPAGQPGFSLRGTARVLSGGPQAGEETLPLLLSDRGYGLLPAATGMCFGCDIPAYGSYLYMESSSGQLDYYFIVGKQQKTILNAYAYLCGLL